MSKKEDNPIIISRNEYKEDLEAEVQYHTARIMATNPFRVTKKIEHVEIPDFGDDKRAKLDWELDFINKCRYGTSDGMSGRYFFHLNACYIKNKERGKIRPDFRASMMDFANKLDKVVKTRGRGSVTFKRRQVGMSWYISTDNIYECTFNKDFDIGMSSKGLTDSYLLFDKHKYVHRNLPKFLRTYINTDRRDAMVFGKWIEKTERWVGNNSSIRSFAPTPTAFAGSQFKRLCLDEIGEVEEGTAMWANGEDTIIQDGVRVGTPILFGTVGDTNKAGRSLREFWKNSEQYNFERLPIFGYQCLIVDDLGNDMIEESVRWIIYERRRMETLTPIIRHKFFQRYPLTQEDAFLEANGTGVGNPMVRAKIATNLMENPPKMVTGWMRPKGPGNPPDFVPDPDGKIIIYERPVPDIKHAYVAACDPAEDDDTRKSRDNSNLSTAILARPFGLDGPKLVAEFTDRPPKLTTYYDQVGMLLKWYNNTPLLVETNKGGARLKDYFEQHYPNLLSLAPKSPDRLQGGFEMTVGVKMTPQRKLQMIGLLESYWEHHADLIPSIRFIEECAKFGLDHADDDLACAFGWALMLLQSDRRVAESTTAHLSMNPSASYQRIGGKLELVNNGAPMRVQIKSNNPLFNR